MGKKNSEDLPTLVEAVCLRDCGFGLACEVVELSHEAAVTGEAQGAIDANPAAVEYAKSIKSQ